MVVFDKCDSNLRKCKTEAQIKEWMQFKYIIVHYNFKRFIQQDFGDERIERSSTLKYYPVAVDVRTDIVNMI